MKLHDVPEGVDPVRLKRYIERAWPVLPGWVVRDALKKKDIRINGARAGADDIIRGGDHLAIYIPDRYFVPHVDVLFDDGHLMAVVKPIGLPVDADDGSIGADTLLERLKALHPTAQLCHRLDTGTGGVIFASLDDETHEAMLLAFERGEIEKRYRAVVYGNPHPDEALLKAFLVKDAQRARVAVYERPIPGAQAIETKYRVLEQDFYGHAELTLLEIGLITGRTHQIRAHLAFIGHPLLGDDKYGDRGLNRQFHAKYPYLWCTHLAVHSCGILSKYADISFDAQDTFVIKG